LGGASKKKKKSTLSNTGERIEKRRRGVDSTLKKNRDKEKKTVSRSEKEEGRRIRRGRLIIKKESYTLSTANKPEGIEKRRKTIISRRGCVVCDINCGPDHRGKRDPSKKRERKAIDVKKFRLDPT